MKPIKLILADPDSIFSKNISDRLRQKGFLLTRAGSLEELTKYLLEDWFHFVVLNINMKDPNDPLDTSGLKILYDERFFNIPKFVIANFPTVSITREVLRPSEKGNPLAVDFLGKDSEIDGILDTIQEAVEKHVRVNWDLVIRQNDVTSILQLAQLIYPELSNTQLITHANELENLVQSIFFNAHQITIGRLLLHKAGLAVVEMTVHGDETKKILCSCSVPGKNDQNRVGLKNATKLIWENSQGSVHFEIKTFNLKNVSRLTSFPEYYSSHNIEEVQESVQKIIDNSFLDLHNHQQKIAEPENLEKLIKDRLELNLDNLEGSITGICQAALVHGVLQLNFDNRSISIHLKNGQTHIFPNPLILLEHNIFSVIKTRILYGLTYGKISGSSVQMDNSGQSWIIDSSMVGFGPIMLDFVALEMIIRNECMEGIDFEDRLIIDEQLLEEESEFIIPTDLLKPYQCIRLLRNCNSSAPLTYLEVLLYTLISHLSTFQSNIEYTSNELIVYLHQLLAAAIILGRLLKNDKIPIQALNGLWIDLKSREVWVEGNRITLTPQDLDILIYLYEHAGEQRSRQMIIDNAMNNLDSSTNSNQNDSSIIYEESRINSAMSRLRLKIEKDPENPKYLHTVRGLGYRLDV